MVWSAEKDEFPYLKGMSAIVSGWGLGVAVWQGARCFRWQQQQKLPQQHGVHSGRLGGCKFQLLKRACMHMPCMTNHTDNQTFRSMHPQALSWLFAPIMAGLATLILFVLVRTFVLRSHNAYQRSIFLLPVFTFLTFFIVTWFIIAR